MGVFVVVVMLAAGYVIIDRAIALVNYCDRRR